MNSIRKLAVASLADAPRNRKVHGDFDPRGRDAWLVDDVREYGVRIPVIVSTDGVLRDGHRRKYAAIAAGVADVPAIVTDDDVFASAQLGRNLSVYAKVVLWRERLDQLIERGNANRAARLNGGPPDESVEQEWIETEAVLGVKRKTLQMAVGLLRKIEALREENPTKARRAETIFREHSWRPAARMLDERVTTPDEDDDPDPEAWEEERPEPDDDPGLVGPRRRRDPGEKQPRGRAAAGDVDRNNPSGPKAPAKGEPAGKNARAKLLRHADEIESILIAEGRYGDVQATALSTLRSSL